LVGEIEPDLRELAAMLAPLGQQIISAGSRADLMAYACDGCVAVALLQSPGHDGEQFATTALLRARSVPVLFIAARHDDDGAELAAAYAHGAVDSLAHPIDANILRCKVSMFVELWQRRETLKRKEAAAREHAERASRAKDHFLATLSHELRNPLNAILGWTRMLRAGALAPERAARAVETIERNANMQAALVEDMLDVSRIITGKLMLKVGPVDVRQVVSAAADTMRIAADAKQIGLELDFDEYSGQASGDPERLQQVVWNLLSNAIKFTPRGGRVVVHTRRVDLHVEIAVEDTGPGIASEFLPFVFDRFRQADGSSTRAHGGLGLGLAIVRHLVELHGGTVSVTSLREASGALFTVRLPLRAIAGAPPPAPADGQERSPRSRDGRVLLAARQLAGVTVLVVDDEPDARELLMAVLAHHGAAVLCAASAAEALELLAAHAPQVMVSDIGMPVTDGYQLIRSVRAGDGEVARVPAAALTGFARIEDGRRALDAGFDVHLIKPIDPTELVETVQRLAAGSAKACAS
jgi:signal transduction histidine kinase/ActR/RegA family two-component response regulator